MSNTEELAARIEEHRLAPYVEELDEQGYAVVPPDVTGVTEDDVDELVTRLLEKSEELIGCRFTVENGPECELDYGDFPGFLERFSGAKPSQFQLMQLCTYHRAFRDLAVNPVAVTLIHHLFGTEGSFGNHWPARFSSHNCFVKWAGEGYGESLGLHVDQGGIPLPWGEKALNANCNWCLTDYTLDDGAFACVPGSHLRKRHPKLPDAAAEAIPHRMSARFSDRLPRCPVARRLSEEDSGPARDHRQFLPPRRDFAAGRHPEPFSQGTGRRLFGPKDLPHAGRLRQPVSVAGVPIAKGGREFPIATADRPLCRQRASVAPTEPRLLADHSVAVAVVHVGIGRMVGTHRGNVVCPRLGAGDATVGVVVV